MKKHLYIFLAAALSGAVFASCTKDKDNDKASYEITVSNDTAKGTTSVKVADAETTKAEAGAEVTITATSAKGYMFMKWTATGVTLTDETANPATFTMPSGKVSIMAEFQAVEAEANCYIVAPGGEAIYIPVSQANLVFSDDGLDAKTDGLRKVTASNYTVELVWADKPVGTGGVVKSIAAAALDGKGYVRVEPGVAGNAVVGVKLKDETKFRWSWHIWVTAAPSSKKDTKSGLTWMDRNLGSAGTTYDAGGRNGLFYQWGRKDAFPASDGTETGNQTYYTGGSTTGTTEALATATYTTLPDMVQNPLTFATNHETYHGSLNVGVDNKSWSNDGKKTLYDPCPVGWKMPPSNVGNTYVWGENGTSTPEGAAVGGWSVWADGRVFNGVDGTSALGHFHPATGRRVNSSGAIDRVGINAYVWSFRSNGTLNAQFLSISSESVSTTYAGSRAYGFTARCVTDE